MFGFKIRKFENVSCWNYISKKETDFCRSYNRDKAFCTIGGFEVTLDLVPDKFFSLEVPLIALVLECILVLSGFSFFMERSVKCLIIENITVVEMRSNKSFIDSC